MEEIIIENKEGKVLVCVLENGEIVEKYQFDTKESATIGNIYLGTVEEILDGIQACFVEIGLNKKAFLSLKDAISKVDLAKNKPEDSLAKKEIKISSVLKKGQKILVQIRKESFEDKGPRISTHVTLAGNYLVLMPETDIITISQKIEESEVRERLMKLVKKELPDNFGCIIRTDALSVTDEEIIFDLQQVLKKWQEIQEKFQNLSDSNKIIFEDEKERLLYDDNQIIQKIARDMIRKTTKKVYINDKKMYEEMKKIAKENILEFQEKQDFISKFGLQTELEKIEHRKIWLKCGAQIVIDKTEALTAIDVNSSRCTGKANLEETIFNINQEAAIEIMKQVRLKDIGGIIVIDFIDMNKQEYKDAILDLMRKEQKKDRSKIEVKDFTQLNLVEMTRKKMYVI